MPASRCSQAKVNRKRFACTGCCLFSTGEDGLKPPKSASSTATEVAWVPRAKARNLLTPDEQQRLDAEALTDANPETRAAYEGATTPQVKRLLLVGLRDAVIRRRLELPPTD